MNYRKTHHPPTYSHSSQQTLRHVSDDDTNEEDHSIEPVIAEDEGNDEEGDAEEDRHASDDVNKVLNLLGNRRLTHFKTGSEVSNSSDNSTIARIHHNAASRT